MLTIVFYKPYPEKPVIVHIPVVDIAFFLSAYRILDAIVRHSVLV
jgi:hypothetical protein